MDLTELAALVDTLRARGVTLTPEGGRVRLDPPSAVTQAERSVLREHREALLVLLSAPQLTEDEEEDEDEAQLQEPRPEAPPTAAETERPIAVPPARRELTGAQREAAGSFLMNGVWTHSRGDQHAEAILSGAVPFETALTERRATTEMLENMRASREDRAVCAIMRRLFK